MFYSNKICVYVYPCNTTYLYIYTYMYLYIFIYIIDTPCDHCSTPYQLRPFTIRTSQIRLMTKRYPFFTKTSSSHQTKRKKKTSSIWGIKSLKVQTSFSWEPGTSQVPDSKRSRKKKKNITRTLKHQRASCSLVSPQEGMVGWFATGVLHVI